MLREDRIAVILSLTVHITGVLHKRTLKCPDILDNAIDCLFIIIQCCDFRISHIQAEQIPDAFRFPLFRRLPIFSSLNFRIDRNRAASFHTVAADHEALYIVQRNRLCKYYTYIFERLFFVIFINVHEVVAGGIILQRNVTLISVFHNRFDG